MSATNLVDKNDLSQSHKHSQMISYGIKSSNVVLEGHHEPVEAIIFIQEEKIMDVIVLKEATHSELPYAYKDWDIIDYGNLVIFPGLIDSNVYLHADFDAEWENIRNCTELAAAGGVTTIIDNPVMTKTFESDAGYVSNLKQRIEIIKANSRIDFGVFGILEPKTKNSVKQLLELGIMGVKCYLLNCFQNAVGHVLPEDLEDLFKSLEKECPNLLVLFHPEIATERELFLTSPCRAVPLEKRLDMEYDIKSIERGGAANKGSYIDDFQKKDDDDDDEEPINHDDDDMLSPTSLRGKVRKLKEKTEVNDIVHFELLSYSFDSQQNDTNNDDSSSDSVGEFLEKLLEDEKKLTLGPEKIDKDVQKEDHDDSMTSKSSGRRKSNLTVDSEERDKESEGSRRIEQIAEGRRNSKGFVSPIKLSLFAKSGQKERNFQGLKNILDQQINDNSKERIDNQEEQKCMKSGESDDSISEIKEDDERKDTQSELDKAPNQIIFNFAAEKMDEEVKDQEEFSDNSLNKALDKEFMQGDDKLQADQKQGSNTLEFSDKTELGKQIQRECHERRSRLVVPIIRIERDESINELELSDQASQNFILGNENELKPKSLLQISPISRQQPLNNPLEPDVLNNQNEFAISKGDDLDIVGAERKFIERATRTKKSLTVIATTQAGIRSHMSNLNRNPSQANKEDLRERRSSRMIPSKIDTSFDHPSTSPKASNLSYNNLESKSPLISPSLSNKPLTRVMSNLLQRRVSQNSSCNTSTISSPRQLLNVNNVNLVELGKNLDSASKREFKFNQSYRTFLANRPQSWEENAVSLILALVKPTIELRVLFQNLSLASSLLKIRQKKKSDERFSEKIAGDCSPSYLFFNEKMVKDGDTRYKVSPPFRNKDNQRLLMENLRLGGIDILSSFHFFVPPQFKQVDEGNFRRAFGGLNSMGFSLQSAWTALYTYQQKKNKKRFTEELIYQKKIVSQILIQLCKAMCQSPAKMLQISQRKGMIQKGGDADFVIWDPYKVTNNIQLNENHIFTGKSLLGVVHKTYLRGKVIYDKDNAGAVNNTCAPEFIKP